MSSFLGVDFFRIVNEGLVDDWAQVYAKVPFEEEELSEKGALFGVLRIKGGAKLVSKGSDIFLWLDEYFNKVHQKGDLRGLVEGLLKVNDKLQAAWAWVIVDEETGERVVKTAALNGGRVVIVRKGQQVVLSGNDDKDKVVVGSLSLGDRLGLGVGGMVDKLAGLKDKGGLGEVFESLNKQIEKETERAVAGLLLEVKKKEQESVVVSPTSEEIVPSSPVNDNLEVVSESKVVGPDGLKKRLVGYYLKNFSKKKKIEIREEKKKNDKVLWLGIVFLVLFLVSVVGGVIKSRSQNVMASWQSELSSWQKREEEAKSLVQINPAGARKLLSEIKEEVLEAESVWVETKYKKEWEDYKLKLDESWIEVSGERKVDPKLFLVLSLVRSNLVGSRLINHEDGIGLLDIDEGLLVRIGLEDKKAEVVDSDSDKKWKAVGGDGENAVFLSDSGLSLLGEEEVRFDATVANPVEVEVFGTGIYVLDDGTGEVWKFSLLGGEIQDRRRWLQPEEEIGVSELVDLDIDGDIWVLGKKGEISRLRRGSRERYALEGKPDNLVGDRLAVQLDGEEMAILDVSSSRIVVFNKESGEYSHQLIWSGFSESKDILYTDDGRLMVLSGGKLYWVE
jgi:hypothetical protein